MQFKKHWKSISSFATGIVAISSVFIVFELEVPRPAWASEIKDLSTYVIEVDNKITSLQLDEAKLQLYKNIRERKKFEEEGRRIPLFLLQEKVILERKINRLETHLKSLRETK